MERDNGVSTRRLACEGATVKKNGSGCITVPIRSGVPGRKLDVTLRRLIHDRRQIFAPCRSASTAPAFAASRPSPRTSSLAASRTASSSAARSSAALRRTRKRCAHAPARHRGCQRALLAITPTECAPHRPARSSTSASSRRRALSSSAVCPAARWG